jgi:hypothetical protein
MKILTMHTILKKYYNIWTVLIAIALLTLLYLSVLYPWINRWGATDAELSMPLPGDGTQPGWVVTSTRVVTVNAPASEVWQWVVQLGQDRAGFYSNDWLENLVLSDIHNQDAIHPDWQSRQVSELILGAGGAIYHDQGWPTRAYQAGTMLYLWGPVVVLPVDAHTSRLYTRTYALPSSGVAQFVSKMSYDWMHFVMERGMLLGIKARTEGNLNSFTFLMVLARVGFILATLGMAFILFVRRRGWAWGLIPLAYALSILVFTADWDSAMAGFLWWGIIPAGFLILGRRWWMGLALATVVVFTIFVIAPYPQLVFGMLFLVLTLAAAANRLRHQPGSLS